MEVPSKNVIEPITSFKFITTTNKSLLLIYKDNGLLKLKAWL